MDELDERAFLFRIQICADVKLFGRIARNEVNKFSLISRFEMQGWVMLNGGLFQRRHIRWVNIVFVELQFLCCTHRFSISSVCWVS